MRNRPVQISNRRGRIHLFECRRRKLVLIGRQTVLLKRQSMFRHELQRGQIIRRRRHAPEQGPVRRELANSRRPHHVIAELGEAVEHALGQQRYARVLVHREKEDAQAHRHFVFPMQRQKRVIHPERIPAGQRVERE